MNAVMLLRLAFAATGLSALAFSMSVTCFAESLPTPGPLDSRVRVAKYNEDEIFRLQGYVGYQIEIEFEPGETVTGQGAGDLEGLSFASFDNHLFLKPKAADVGTNLSVATNRRNYRFDYTVAAGPPDPRKDTVMYVVRFIYPLHPAQAGPTPGEVIEQRLGEASTGRSQNLDYWFCGDTAIRPVWVSDDGVQTHLRFGVRGELPALFVRNDDGSESLLNFTMNEGDVVVHRVAQKFVVRRGQLTGCIVNRAFNGGGERLESGTVSPEVRRERRGLP